MCRHYSDLHSTLHCYSGCLVNYYRAPTLKSNDRSHKSQTLQSRSMQKRDVFFLVKLLMIGGKYEWAHTSYVLMLKGDHSILDVCSPAQSGRRFLSVH